MDVESVVIAGGSVSGLAAAAALAPLAGHVTVVERSQGTAGSVAPQGQLPHVMCAAGSAVLEELLPGFAAALLNQGASAGGNDPDRLPVYWYAAGAVRRNLVLPDPGFPRALCGRRFIEPELRRRVSEMNNVDLVRGSAHAGIWAGERLAGLRLKDGTELPAGLVVDATGRTGAFRTALGLGEPPVTEVGVDLRYVGIVVERRPEDGSGAEVIVLQNTPSLPRIGVALPLDCKRWHVVLGGYFGDSPPTDPVGASEFARSLADPTIAPLLERPFLEEPARYTFRSSQRRHWERMPHATPGVVSIGDAVASFNPIYGQGMSSALLQAKALAEQIRAHGATPGHERQTARRLAKIVNDPWMVATGADLAYRQTIGTRPRGHAAVGRYIERVMRCAAIDDKVNQAFTAVQQMLARPGTLFAPPVAARVLRPQHAALAP